MKRKTGSNRKALTVLESEIVTFDKKLVDEAAVWICKKLDETVYRGTVEIGNYVIDTFFKGDIEAITSKNPHKDASFGALTEKCGTQELPMSKSALSRAVGIAIIVRQQPDETSAFKQLAPSMQEALLPLRDPAKVEKVAKQAVAKEMSVREVRDVVADELAKTPKNESRGRRPAPLITKTLERSLKQFTFKGGKRSFTNADVDALDDDQKKAALGSAEALIEKLKDLVIKLKRA